MQTINNEEEFLFYCRIVNSPALKEYQQVIADELKKYDEKHNANRIGKWHPVYSQTRIWLQDPRPQDFKIEDIAHALSNICRYGGHCKQFYSVAQHSVCVSRIVKKEFCKEALFHDASEAYIGDCITPLKTLLPEYMKIEANIMAAIAEKFSLDFSVEACKDIKRADIVMLATEIRDLTPSKVHNGNLIELPLSNTIIDCWEPKKAESEFLMEYYTLYGK